MTKFITTDKIHHTYDKIKNRIAKIIAIISQIQKLKIVK